jgi:hypothetical protein
VHGDVLAAAAQIQHLAHGILRRAEHRRHAGGVLRVLIWRRNQRPSPGQIRMQAVLAVTPAIRTCQLRPW